MGLRWVCVLMLAVTSAVAQDGSGSVSGTVVDVTSAGIPGALITIESPMPMAGAVADSIGRFVIHGIPPGTYSLVIQVAGFLQREFEVQIEDGKETSEGRVTLEIVPPPPCRVK